jgi:hypothetical protein
LRQSCKCRADHICGESRQLELLLTTKGAAGMGKKLRVVEKRKRAKKNIKRKKQEKNKKTSLR